MATYTIIGADQKPYNLVTEDNIRAWIAEGRLNPQSLIRGGDDTEWRALADFPEFAAALAAKAAPEDASASLSAETAAPAPTSGLAIASLVLGLLGITALLGLVLGIVARVKIKRSRGTLGGGGIALAGIIVSLIFLLLTPTIISSAISALAGFQGQAQSINCVSNAKGLVGALRQYAGDNQGRYPAATNWCDALLRSNSGLTNTLHCPADFPGSRCSYAFNARVAGMEAGSVAPNTVVIFEAAGGWNISGGRELIPGKSRHGQVFAVGFADGHVEQLPATLLPQLRWEP
jgi:prepilin-type processing-associated H-X9-DG protein